MSYLDIYKTRLQASGDNSTDGIVFSSKHTVKNNFSNSLFSELVLINDDEYEAIITQGEKSNDKQLLLKPDVKINIGSVVKIKESNYLVFDFLGDGINEIYPTATLKLCNNSLTVKGEPTETQVGTNPYTGEPVYEYQDGVPTTYPCIVTMQLENENLENQPIRINNDVVQVTLPYFDFKETQIELYENIYQVKTVDKTKVINGVGLLTVLGEKV
ncbi:hypothetical protein BAOM_3114 [Peribacillus asahii]|uniref:Uncharacterized protein n=1 Tax=Peribacillus asahii TaxID=228899 RepID=A0A3Q9RQ13_9BACI|nr:hypothetical protein [Peribacillus asahii]AZV43723.1 hypothetical protein BAOM_3114 [Peribacillus asahii]